LIGELGSHQIDAANWFLNSRPVAVTGVSSLAFWKDDGRDVPDTVQITVEYPNSVFLNYDATLANSFDGAYEMFFGSDAAVMLRESNAWMFKEVDSPLLGWEVYARKENFYKETGIVLKAGASKSVPGAEAAAEQPYTNTALSFALKNFLRNAAEVTAAAEDYIASFGEDEAGLVEQLSKMAQARPPVAISRATMPRSRESKPTRPPSPGSASC
jgi:predicted dehydrogenase